MRRILTVFLSVMLLEILIQAPLSAQSGNAEAAVAKAAKNCSANYILDNAGTIATGWKELGSVSGAFKKKECKKLAIARCDYAKEKFSQYAPVGSANFNAMCSAGKVGVYFDTLVDGRRNSKDGFCWATVSCQSKTNCTCPAGYWNEDPYCVTKACQPVNPKPANNTSFINTGFFFWEGELRHRTNRSCTTVWTGYN